MLLEYVDTLRPAFISIVSAVALRALVEIIIERRNKKLPGKTYSERLSELTANLTKASKEVDCVLREMAQVAKEREATVNDLEAGLINLEKRGKELKEEIEILENVPIPVAEHFARLVKPGEKRSARRDYFLFMAGVIVTTFIAILLQMGAGK